MDRTSQLLASASKSVSNLTGNIRDASAVVRVQAEAKARGDAKGGVPCVNLDHDGAQNAANLTPCPACPQIKCPSVGAKAAGTASAVPSGKLWLTIAIPTFPRKGDKDYLSVTLSSLLAELPSTPSDPAYGRVQVVVMNNKPQAHAVFDAVRARYEADEHARTYVRFVENPGTFPDPRPDLPDPDDLNNPTNRPGHEVRKQTADLVILAELAMAESEYFLWLEDDFRTCPHALQALRYALQRADETNPNWLAVRMSYGMNGVLMRSADVPPLLGWWRQEIARLPPDLLWQEWIDPHAKNTEITNQVKGRPLVVFQHNLWDHMGSISTFAVRPERAKWPGCYEPMSKVWSLSAHEKFSRKCDAFEVSPCAQANAGVGHGARIDWGALKAQSVAR